MIAKTPAAKRDLLDHYITIGSEDPDTAEGFLDEVQRVTQRLSAFPESGRRWPSTARRLAGMRVAPVPHHPSYLVFYRIDKRGILIVRVLHGARQIERVLDEDGHRRDGDLSVIRCQVGHEASRGSAARRLADGVGVEQELHRRGSRRPWLVRVGRVSARSGRVLAGGRVAAKRRAAATKLSVASARSILPRSSGGDQGRHRLAAPQQEAQSRVKARLGWAGLLCSQRGRGEARRTSDEAIYRLLVLDAEANSVL